MILPLKILKSEARAIRTPNRLIWSQTRYRCAIAPLQKSEVAKVNTGLILLWAGTNKTPLAGLEPAIFGLEVQRVIHYATRARRHYQILEVHFHRAKIKSTPRKNDPGRTRTYNLRFRRPMPYPLGHRASTKNILFAQPNFYCRKMTQVANAKTPPAGIEPATFRLTAERSNH